MPNNKSLIDKLKKSQKKEKTKAEKLNKTSKKSPTYMKKAETKVSDDRKLADLMEELRGYTQHEFDKYIYDYLYFNRVAATSREALSVLVKLPKPMRNKLIDEWASQSEYSLSRFVENFETDARKMSREEKSSGSNKLVKEYANILRELNEEDIEETDPLKRKEMEELFGTVYDDIEMEMSSNMNTKAGKMLEYNRVREEDVPGSWIDEENSRIGMGMTRGYSEDKELDGWERKRDEMSMRSRAVRDPDNLMDEIWNLKSMIKSQERMIQSTKYVFSDELKETFDAGIKILNILALADGKVIVNKEISKALSKELKSKGDGVAKYVSKLKNRLKKLRNKLHEMEGGYGYLERLNLAEMKINLYDLETRLPLSSTKYDELDSCISMYKAAEWVGEKVSKTMIACNKEYERFFVHPKDSIEIDVDGEKTVVTKANTLFFRMLCFRGDQRQEGNILKVSVPPAIKKYVPELEDVEELDFLVVYVTKRGEFLIQDEEMFSKEKKFIKTKRATVRDQIEIFSESKVTLEIVQKARLVLANALNECVKRDKTLTSGVYDVNYTVNSPLVYNTVNDLSMTEDNEYVTVKRLAEGMASILLYLGPAGSKIFSTKIANGHYGNNMSLANLPEEEKNPEGAELFSYNLSVATDTNPTEAVDYLEKNFTSEYSTFVKDFVADLYVSVYGFRNVSYLRSGKIEIDKEKGCQNFEYLTNVRNSLIQKESEKPESERMEIPDFARQDSAKFENVDPREIIYYMEDGRVFCFTVPELTRLIRKAEETESSFVMNPVTKDPFSEEFIDNFKNIYMMKSSDVSPHEDFKVAVKDERIAPKKKEEVELAPNLITKLKKGLKNLRTSSKVKEDKEVYDHWEDQFLSSDDDDGGFSPPVEPDSPSDSDSLVEPDSPSDSDSLVEPDSPSEPEASSVDGGDKKLCDVCGSVIESSGYITTIKEQPVGVYSVVYFCGKECGEKSNENLLK